MLFLLDYLIYLFPRSLDAAVYGLSGFGYFSSTHAELGLEVETFRFSTHPKSIFSDVFLVKTPSGFYCFFFLGISWYWAELNREGSA